MINLPLAHAHFYLNGVIISKYIPPMSLLFFRVMDDEGTLRDLLFRAFYVA